MAAALRFLGRNRYEAPEQAAQVVPLGHMKLERVRFFQEVLPELLRQFGEFTIDDPQPHTSFALEVHTTTHEVLVGLVQQVELLGAQIQMILSVVHGFDAGVEITI